LKFYILKLDVKCHQLDSSIEETRLSLKMDHKFHLRIKHATFNFFPILYVKQNFSYSIKVTKTFGKSRGPKFNLWLRYYFSQILYNICEERD